MQVGLGGLCGKDHYMQSSPAPLPQSESADGLIVTPTCRQGVSVLLKDFGPSIPGRSGTPLGAWCCRLMWGSARALSFQSCVFVTFF